MVASNCRNKSIRFIVCVFPRWSHQMETFSVLLVLCARNSPVNIPHKGQWCGALVFSFCVWINVWVNNREAGDLRRHRAHYDVTVMLFFHSKISISSQLHTKTLPAWFLFNFILLKYVNVKSLSASNWWYRRDILTHWGRVTHICVSKLTVINSDNGLSPGRRQAITWTNGGILLMGPLGTNFSEILSKIHTSYFKKMHFKTSSAKWRPFCLGLNELN